MTNSEGMTAQTYVNQVTTKELPDELQFRFDRSDNKALQLIVLVFLAVFGLTFLIKLSPAITQAPVFFLIMFVIIVGGILYLVISIARTRNRVYTTALSVTAQRLEATGDNLNSDWMGYYNRPGTVVFPVSEVRMLGYAPGGKYSPGGLCVNSRIVMGGIIIQGRCLLPGLNREQSMAVVVAIVRRFPEIGNRMKRNP
jgi:hypothetical protein